MIKYDFDSTAAYYVYEIEPIVLCSRFSKQLKIIIFNVILIQFTRHLIASNTIERTIKFVFLVNVSIR